MNPPEAAGDDAAELCMPELDSPAPGKVHADVIHPPSAGERDWADAGESAAMIGSMKIHEVTHPLAAARLTIMRDRATDNAAFRAALADISSMLVYEAAQSLDVETFPVTTPVGQAEGTRLSNPPILVPIIRAGLGMVDAALRMIPDAQVGFIGLARDEETHQPVPYLEALPESLEGRAVFLLDPMLATGGSLVHALRLLAERGADNITVVCIVSSAQGVETLRDCDVPVRSLTTASIDPDLNDDAYIIPGLGDAGDRLYGPRNIELDALGR